MRNPSRTLQTSIFEPLFAREEELPFQPNKPIQSDSSHWLPHSLSSSFSSAPPNPNKATMRRAAATIFNDDISEDSSSAKANERVREREPVTCDHVIPGMHSPSGSSSTIPTSTSPSCPPSRSRSSSDVIDYDDGSVASKLLTSITKSISSPSLLACCKESARETPYQKTLRLRKMKLQHCAEELGSESSDGSLCDGDYYNIFDSLRTMSSFERSSQSTTEAHQKSEGNANSVMISVKSSPNLRCPSLAVSKHTSQIKERSFPPPLTHTLPKSTSSDSFSYSLRAYREDGRFVLKEVKVPCRQYFQSSRKDGRLTLQLLTTDVDFESKHSEETNKESRDLQEDDKVGVYQATACVIPEKAKGGSCDKIEVESANIANLVGKLEVCIVKENKKIDHLGMDNIDEKSDVEEVGCLSANSLIMATLSNGSCGSSKDDIVNAISHVTASSKIKPDFKAAKCKTGKASRMRLSNQHLLSSSKERQSHIHPPGKSPKLKLGHDFDITKFSQCQESLGLEIKSTNGGGKTLLQGFERTSASLQKSGYGVEKSASSTIIFKDVSAKCLMENVTKLVASFGLDGGKWSCGEEMKSRELEENSLYNSDAVMESSMYNGIKSINIGVREIENGSHKAISGVSFDVKCERSFRCGAVKESDCVDVARSCLPSSSFHFDLQVPYSTNNQATFQGKEWLHTLHCKEILYRNQLAKGFMKLHCVA